MPEEKYKILLADDERIILLSLSRILEKEGYEISTAKDGALAWEMVQKNQYDLIISDVMMPHETGIDLLNHIQELKNRVPVILMTGMPSVDAAVESLKVGAVDYLSKPFDIKKFLKVIKKALCDHSQSEEPDNHLPIIDNHRIIEPIGEGTSGVVFLVEVISGEEIGKKRALKMLKLSTFPEVQHDEMRQRFLIEAKAAAKIEHENVIKFYKYGLAKDDNIPYIIMEYFPSMSLKEAMPIMASFSYQRKTEYLLQIASALSVIHKHGICHRDIKPANMMVDVRNNILKISDFGIAKMPGINLNLTQNLIGSPCYMSPESYISSNVDYRADIFSLGILAYELFVGMRPFDGANVGRLVQQIPNDKPIEPKQIFKDFPPILQDIIAKMLRKKAEDRYQNLDDAIADIKTFMAGNDNALAKCSMGNFVDWH